DHLTDYRPRDPPVGPAQELDPRSPPVELVAATAEQAAVEVMTPRDPRSGARLRRSASYPATAETFLSVRLGRLTEFYSSPTDLGGCCVSEPERRPGRVPDTGQVRLFEPASGLNYKPVSYRSMGLFAPADLAPQATMST